MKNVMKQAIKKNLPDKFPIRHALLVQVNEECDTLDNLDFLIREQKEKEVLFRQLLLILQQEPLSKEMLSIGQSSIKLDLLGIEIINIAKIGRDTEWFKLVEKRIKEILPDTEVKSWAVGEAFILGLYNYAGNCEIPAFIRAHYYISENDFASIRAKFGHSISKDEINFFYNTYEKVRTGKIDDFELYKLFNQYEKPLYITSYQSDLWKMLDKSSSSGSIPPARLYQSKMEEIKNLIEKNNYTQKISITVCKSWESLFAEEIMTLYKMFRFCNNCGKALPFGYKGSYCPNTKINKECVKARARIRSQKRNITKK